jgi:hypothetical protein
MIHPLADTKRRREQIRVEPTSSLQQEADYQDAVRLAADRDAQDNVVGPAQHLELLGEDQGEVLIVAYCRQGREPAHYWIADIDGPILLIRLAFKGMEHGVLEEEDEVRPLTLLAILSLHKFRLAKRAKDSDLFLFV